MRRHLEVAAAILGMLLLLTCSGGYFFLEIPLVLLMGWIWYLMRVIPEIEVNYSALAMGFIALGLFLLGTHVFALKLAEEFNRDDPASSLNGDDRPKGWAFRSTFALVTLTIVAFTAGISIVGIVHQGVWMVRSGPILQSGMTAVVSRMNSQSNLKQVGIAMHNYHYGCDGVPPGAFFSDDGRPQHGWAAILSPYLEQVEPVDIDLNVPWDDPVNAEAFKQTPSTFLQPGEERTHNAQGLALNHYSSNVYVMGGEHMVDMDEIVDGTSNTIMVGEIADGYPAWGYPVNWRDPALGVDGSKNNFGSAMTEGANFVFVDGSAKYISPDIDPRVLKALSTPAGGEPPYEEEQ